MRLFLAFGLLLLLFSCKSNVEEEISEQDYLLNRLASDKTGVAFINQIKEDEEHSIINYIYYYNGAGVAAGDINNDGLPDLFFVSNMGPNKLYLNKGDMQFEDISEAAGISGKASWNTGVTMVDINADGYLDIYVSAVSGLLDFEGHNELYVNNGDGTFTERAAEFGLDLKGYTTQTYFFDYDNDGDLDLYVVNHAIHTTLSHGPANLRNKREALVGDRLLENRDGQFIDVSEAAGIYGGVNGYGLSASLADFNNDGFVDIYVCNDFHEDDYYYLNNGDGTFTEALDQNFTTISRFSMGSDATDITGNGYPDLITLDMLPDDEVVVKQSEGDDVMYNMQKHLGRLGYKDQFARNMLHLNKEAKYFTETALFNEVAATDWSWAPLFADFNNDGKQDLFISNGILRRPNDLDFKNFVATAFKNRSPDEGMKWLYKSREEMPSGEAVNQIYEGNLGRFNHKTGSWIEDRASFSNGAIYVDLDNDGDLDLVVNNLNEPAAIYENTTNSSGNFLGFSFKYKDQNPEAIGVKVLVFSEGNLQSKQLFRSRGFQSAVDARIHFGLGKSRVDSVHVIWPDKSYQRLQVKPNSYQEIAYAPEGGPYVYPESASEEIFRKIEMLSFEHIEDDYDDFFNEKLIPYKVSRLGPAIAVADITGNGFEDVFLGSASGKAAALYLNDGKQLKASPIKAFENDYNFEDNIAVFFDANGDGSPDLYVGSGVNRNRLQRFEVDRLYINNQGNFEKAEANIPENNEITSTLAVADVDGDGDLDIFVGNYSRAGDFGKKVNSYILINDGKANFSKLENFEISAHVTSALWEDINDDGFPDLIVMTEWDTPKIFLSHKGNLKPVVVPDSLSGLWQSVAYFDVDGDGERELIFGNWGLNSRFNATAEAPLRLYYGDFNADGKPETLVAYNIDGKYYPLNSRSELKDQMSFISKKFPSNKAFAGKSIEEIFSPAELQEAEIYEVSQLASGYMKFENGEPGEFKRLPDDFQLGPINQIKAIEIGGEKNLIFAGNTERMKTYHGHYTSFKGIILKTIEDYAPVSNFGLDAFHTEIRAVESLEMAGGQLLLVAPNADSLKTYSFN